MTLPPEEAIQLARRLSLMPRFSAHPEATVHVADELRRLCQGEQISGGIVYDPGAQARWLVRQVEYAWAVWPGLGALRRIYESRFCVQEDTTDQPEPAPPPVPEPVCPACQSFGIVLCENQYRWCGCPDSQRLKSEAPDLVDRLNRNRQQHAQHKPAPDPQRVRAALAADLARRKQPRRNPYNTGEHADR